jgi:hypothetical protein
MPRVREADPCCGAPQAVVASSNIAAPVRVCSGCFAGATPRGRAPPAPEVDNVASPASVFSTAMLFVAQEEARAPPESLRYAHPLLAR